jgi:HTH-type transcriptional regulator, competence development regulator
MPPAVASESFGSRIRRRRRESALTQRGLAAKVGVDFTYLSKLENDQEGQSPGEELVRKLAAQLDDDPDELLALAGKVPVDALRTRARQDSDFAWFLRMLPDLPEDQISRWVQEAHELSAHSGEAGLNMDELRLRLFLQSLTTPSDRNLADLVATPGNMSLARDAHILVRLENVQKDTVSPGDGSDVVVKCYYSAEFSIQQDEYLIGLVGTVPHRDRLRDGNAAIHDILVVMGDERWTDMSVDEIVHKYGISVRYRAKGPQGDDYVEAKLSKVADLPGLWQSQSLGEGFPLLVLRAAFPSKDTSQSQQIHLAYEFTVRNDQRYWFWTASRPIHVSTITVQAKDLTRDRDCTFEKFLPSYQRTGTMEDGSQGTYKVNVSNWVLKGHGVSLTWSPR